MMTNTQKSTGRLRALAHAYRVYEQWTQKDCPDLDLDQTLIIMLGAMVNYSDDRPDWAEARLMANIARMIDERELNGAASPSAG